MRFRDQVADGYKSAFRFGGQGGSRGGRTGGYLAGLAGIGMLSPSAEVNYKRAAGPLWLNGVVLTCIKWQCRTFPEAPQVVYRPDADPEKKAALLRRHAALEILKRPNRYYSRSVLNAGILLSLGVDGNAYLYKERSAAGKVAGLVYVPHFQMEPDWTQPTEHISRYLYRVDGDTLIIPREDVIHLRNGIDPTNPRKGLSDFAAELRSVYQDNETLTFHCALLRNMGVPATIISPKGTGATGEGARFSPEAAKGLKEMWMERVTGENRGMPIVPSIPIEVSSPGLTPQDLALDKLAQMPIPRICAAIGLDPMAVGLPSDSKTYSNYEEAREAAYEGNVIPLHREIDEQMTLQLMPEIIGAKLEDELGRDYSHVRALQPDMAELYKRVSLAVGGPWLRPNEGRSEAGFDDMEGGDVLYPPRSSATPPEGDPAPADEAMKRRREIAMKWRRRLEAERDAA